MDPRPSQHVAIVTCMDARYDALDIAGLDVGEAHVLRNAGGRVTEDVLRSLALSVHVFDVVSVAVVQHTECGLAGATDDDLRERTGADLSFLPIDDHEDALADDVERVLAAPFLEPLSLVTGLLYDLGTGETREVVRRERSRRAHAGAIPTKQGFATLPR